MDTQDSTGVDPAALIVGSQLKHPLYDDRDILLLSQGSTVTEDIKHILTHKLKKVRVHQDDMASVVRDPAQAKSAPIVQFDGELRQQLDEMVDAGLFCCENSGPPLRDSMTIYNRKAFSQEQRERLNSQHRDSSDALNAMMRKALQGGAVDGKDVRRLTAANLESMTEDCENAITVVTEADDKGVSEQSLQTALLGMAIGIEMGLDAQNVRIIGTTGLVADWGMMHLPEDVRGAKWQLDEREFFEIQKVPILTANMLQNTSGLPRLVLPITYQIHEKTDGTGYPRGKDENSIHPFAKILHVADLYTALTSPGLSKRPAMPYAAIECILREASNKSVNTDVARALLQVLSLFPIGSYVALSDRSVARVLRRNGREYSSPVVQIVLAGSGNQLALDDEDTIIVPAERGLEITQALPTPGRDELSSEELLDFPA